MRTVCLHPAALLRALGILDQKPSLGPFHKTDHQDQGDDHDQHTANHDTADRSGTAAFEKVDGKARELRHNARHDDERYAVANTPACYLLTQPQKEHGPADKVDDRYNAELNAGINNRLQAALRAVGFKPAGKEPPLYRAQKYSAVSGILVELLASGFAFLLQRNQTGVQR